MSLNDCFKDDLNNIFLNNSEFSQDIIIAGETTRAVVNFSQDLVKSGNNFYAAASIDWSICETPIKPCDEVVIDGVTWIAHEQVQSDGYGATWLVRSKEAHRFG